MAWKLDMLHWVLEYCLDCLDNDLFLILTYGRVKYGKMLEHMILWKVLKIFIQEGSNDDLG